ncbi:MAG: hypothetical protein IPP68_03905 [Elusimicrobia bacterium]|nr:hypothetical protein [Elusimicrobiota bacterium]
MISWEEFCLLAEKTFRFLETDFNFKLDPARQRPFLDYRGDKVKVSLYYEPVDRPELDLGIDRIQKFDKYVPSFAIYELKRLQGHPPPGVEFPPKTRAEMETVLSRMADELKTYAQEVLRGDLHELDLIERARQDDDKRNELLSGGLN